MVRGRSWVHLFQYEYPIVPGTLVEKQRFFSLMELSYCSGWKAVGHIYVSPNWPLYSLLWICVSLLLFPFETREVAQGTLSHKQNSPFTYNKYFLSLVYTSHWEYNGGQDPRFSFSLMELGVVNICWVLPDRNPIPFIKQQVFNSPLGSHCPSTPIPCDSDVANLNITFPRWTDNSGLANKHQH